MARCHFIRLINILTVSTSAFLIVYGILRIIPHPTVVIYNRKNDFTLGRWQAVTNNEQKRVITSRKDAKEMKMDERVQDIKYKGVVKSSNSSVYMYSAIQIYSNELGRRKRETPSTEEPAKAWMSMIVVSGWESNQNQSSNFTCCHMMENGSVIPISSSEKRISPFYMRKAELKAKQYTCNIINNSSSTQRITIESSGSVCPVEEKYYTVVEAVFSNRALHQNNRNKTIAVCSKLAYGSLDARRLIEWFEVHRMFGVDKVFSYLYKLNPAARKVFEYYENLGIVETREFNLPEIEPVTREVGSKNMQSWNDEQVTLYDCQERTRNYDYVAVVDTDEFMIPSTNGFKNAWKTFLDNVFQNTKNAGFFFPVNVHVTNWGPSRPNHSLFIGQYNNCTIPIFDRVKGIHMPSRVKPGSVFTHMFVPLPGYKKKNVDGKSASLHHFRNCRRQWMNPRSDQNIKKRNNWLYYFRNATKCYDFRRLPSDIMERVADAVQESVIRVINEIGV